MDRLIYRWIDAKDGQIIGQMAKRIAGWMEGQMNGLIGIFKDGRLERRMGRWTDRQMERWLNDRIDGWKDRQTRRQTDKQTDGRMDSFTKCFRLNGKMSSGNLSKSWLIIFPLFIS